MVDADFKVANYLPRGSTDLPRPSEGAVAGVVQTVLASGRVGAYRTNATFPQDIQGEGGG